MGQPHSDSQRRRLFFIANLSVCTIGVGFAVRAGIAADLQAAVYDRLDLASSATLLGEALGATFLGFALTLLFGSALVDWVGMRLMLLFSALGYVAGAALVLLAAALPPDVYSVWLIYAGLLLTGLGWGAVEAASNPLVAALYPGEKTRRLNVLHAWWPGGIVIGGLLGWLIDVLGLAWQWNLVLLMAPALALAVLSWSTAFPASERVASGISTREMFQELWRSPGLLIWLSCMALTTASELAPGQWVDLALSRIVGMQGILLLVYVSVLMFVLRHFAGHLAKRIAPVGILWCGSACAAGGLYLLSVATTPVSALLAATLWGVGVCYFYPTMVACVAERYVRGGALFMGILGFVGGMSLQIVMPFMGAVYDRAKLEAAGSAEQLQALAGADLDNALRAAASASFQSIALLPLLLLPLFGGIWLYERLRAGQGKTVAGRSSA